MHLYRWDLDKTYLATDIGSVRGLLRAAVEPASRKRNVPGSGALLRALERHDRTAGVSILSGSPEQMRPVLEEKLALDGVRYDKLILKDNLGNLRRGRLRAVRGQVGYKLPHLLELRIGIDSSVGETLFGDDSETDAAIYGVYADAVAGRTSPDEVRAVMKAGDAYSDAVERALAALARVERGDAVEDIFIRMEPRVPLKTFRLLGPRVTPVFSWFQAAAVLRTRDRIDAEGLAAVAMACSHDPLAWTGWLADLVRRRVLTAEAALDAVERTGGLHAARPHVERAMSRLGPVSPPPAAGRADYLAFLRAVRSR